MALRNIIKISEEHLLRRKSKEIDVFDLRLKELIRDMEETLKQEDGAGLAAPQIGILKRVIVCNIDGKVMEFINPRITASSGEIIESEGCLSIPGKRGSVARPASVTAVYQNMDGAWFKMEAKEWNARVLCHEIDHLNGILYIDKAIKVEKV